MIPEQQTRSGLSIVIPSWNGQALLEEFLPTVLAAAAAFEAACVEATEVIVADDASDDQTRAWLAARFPRVRCESSAQRAGFAPTANRGVQAARYGLVYLLNNDVALEPATLPPLTPHFHAPRTFAVASQVYDFSTGIMRGAGQVGEFRRGFLGVHRRYFVPEPVTAPGAPWLTLFATGGSSLFDREKFLALGGFNPSFAPFGWEDVELSLRAWKQGFEVHYEPRSCVWHRFSSTIGSSFPRRQARMTYERNRLLAHWLHLDATSEMARHVLFLLAKLMTDPFAGRAETWKAAAQALERWDDVRLRRRWLRSRRQRLLSDVLAEVAGQLRRPGARLLVEDSAPRRPYSPSSADGFDAP